MTDALYLSDDEIARRLGVSQTAWTRSIAPVLAKAGLPPPDPLFGGLRYWPAVRAFLDRRSGLGTASADGGPRSGFQPDGEENFHEQKRTGT